MKKIKVLIVDDHTLMRSGLRLMLSAQEDIEVVGEAADGNGGIAMAQKMRPDVVLLDISMPGMNGLECLNALLANQPDLKVILLTMHEDARYVKEGFALGAMGYVLKKAADDVLYQAVRVVYSGEMYIQPSITKAVVAELTERPRVDDLRKPLSDQEKKVLSLIAAGYANREIAEQLVISVKTVETYKYRIMDKLNCKKRSDLVKFALDNGLLNKKN